MLGCLDISTAYALVQHGRYYRLETVLLMLNSYTRNDHCTARGQHVAHLIVFCFYITQKMNLLKSRIKGNSNWNRSQLNPADALPTNSTYRLMYYNRRHLDRYIRQRVSVNVQSFLLFAIKCLAKFIDYCKIFFLICKNLIDSNKCIKY